MSDNSYTLALCTCCMIFAVNNERCEPEDCPCAPLSRVMEPGQLSMGTVHECEDFEAGLECPHDEPHFSNWGCDGCGSRLAGDRFAFTFTPIADIHTGHYSTFGTYFCDTCNSPYCVLA